MVISLEAVISQRWSYLRGGHISEVVISLETTITSDTVDTRRVRSFFRPVDKHFVLRVVVRLIMNVNNKVKTE